MSDIPTQPQQMNGLTSYRLQTAETGMKELEERIEDLEKVVHNQAVEIATLRERVSIFSLAQASLTLIIGAVAAFIGRLA